MMSGVYSTGTQAVGTWKVWMVEMSLPTSSSSGRMNMSFFS